MAGFFDSTQGFGQGQPAPFDTQEAELARKRKLQEAMLASNLQAPIVGNTGMAQAIARLATSYFLAKQGQQLDTQGRQVATARREDLTQGLQDYLRTKEGTPGETLSVAQAENLMRNDTMPEGGLAEPVKGDPRKAVLAALASQHPELQAIGKAELAKEPKAPEFQFVQGQGGGIYKGNKATGELVEAGRDAKPTDKYTDPYYVNGPNGKVLVQRNERTGQLEAVDKAAKVTATASSSSNPMIAGPKAGVEEWAKLAGKTVGELSEQARAGQQTLRTLSQLERLNTTGVPGGPAANASVFLQNLAQQAGIPIDKSKLSDAETFNSLATQAWASMMQQMGGARGLVKEESEKIAASLPALIQSPQGRQQIINTMRAAAEMSIATAKEAASQYSGALQSGNLQDFTFGLSQTQLPNMPTTLQVPNSPQGQPRKPTVSNW